MRKRRSNGFHIGDVIFNGFAGDWNCYSIVIGRAIVQGEPCYVERTLVLGKLSSDDSYSSIYADKRKKIGKIDIVSPMEQCIAKHQSGDD